MVGKYLRHWAALLVATGWLILAFIRAAWYFNHRAMRDLAIPDADKLTSKEIRRLKHYFYGTAYLSAVFCLYRGRTRTPEEKRLFSNLAALAYFFDDLVDAYRYQDVSGVLWQDNPEQYGQTADSRGLALHFLHNVYEGLQMRQLEDFRHFMHRVFNIETAGRQQGLAPLSTLELEQITADKGGYSVLMFRRILSNPLDETELRLMYRFGALVQLCDDIFDVWFDLQSNTRTLPIYFLEKNNVPGLQAFFEHQYGLVKSAFPPGKRATGAAMHFLITLTRVCLDHYADLAKKYGTLPLQNRSAMVVDMEKWRNRIKAAWYLGANM